MEKISFLIIFRQLFSLRAAVDIVLIAAGIFMLYQILLRSGAWKIVTGIILAIVFFFLASLLNLRGIEWIYSNLSPVAVIALIVIFQPELRKFLERAASMRRVEKAQAGDELVGIISESLLNLSNLRQGAIVVLPGKEPVEGWVSGGFILDAAPSFPLMMSIFDPHSPGHDGALVIDKGRFTILGGRLPISQTQKLPAELGTRHHSAMGLAEQSDALVLVVSEERGTISIFQDGEYQKLIKKEDIANAIRRHWEKTAAFPMELNKRNMEWPVLSKMIVSIVLSIVFWITLTVSEGKLIEGFATVPVEFIGVPPNLVLVSDKEKQIRVHMAGTKSAIDSVSASMLSVKIDLSKAGAGKQTFLITDESIALPKDVQLVDISPSSLEINMAAVSVREVEIKPQLVGTLRGKLKLLSVDIKPSKVKALAPNEQAVDEMMDVTTTPIYLDNVTQNTMFYCKIIAPPSIQPLDKRWPDVVVRLFVSETGGK